MIEDENLVDTLGLERIEVNLFRGTTADNSPGRIFGGQVAGQALVAAGRTVDHGHVHSLHAYFLRPGDPKIPIVYDVDRIRDGRSFTTRRVVAIQHGEAIFHLSASFQPDEPGVEHEDPMPRAPDPERLPTWRERVSRILPRVPRGMGDWLTRDRPIELRYVDELPILSAEPRPAEQQVWMRADGKLPDDPPLHQVVVAYASDMTLLDTALLPHGVPWIDEQFMMASLDHAMWFHRRFRADEWLLYQLHSPTAAGARGFTRGEIWTHDGHLAVSVVQEGLIRHRSVR